MASIKPNGSGYRVQVYVKGVRDSGTFPTRKEAAQWALEREAELKGAKLPDKTFADAMDEFARKVSEGRDGAHWEIIRLNALARYPIAKRRLEALAANDFADWSDARRTQVKPATRTEEHTSELQSIIRNS